MTPEFLNKIAVRLGLTRNQEVNTKDGLLPWTEKIDTEFIYPLSGGEKKMRLEPIPYDKEMVEHLTDQLIKLQRAYDTSKLLSAQNEIQNAMKTINKSLEMILKPQAIIKVDQML